MRAYVHVTRAVDVGLGSAPLSLTHVFLPPGPPDSRQAPYSESAMAGFDLDLIRPLPCNLSPEILPVMVL